MSDGASGEVYDTGVTLVSHHRLPKSGAMLHLPLDIVVPGYSVDIARIEGRVDRIHIAVGDRQLPPNRTFMAEDGQRLLIVTSRFLGILASGEAARLQLLEAPKRPQGLRRLLPGRG